VIVFPATTFVFFPDGNNPGNYIFSCSHSFFLDNYVFPDNYFFLTTIFSLVTFFLTTIFSLVTFFPFSLFPGNYFFLSLITNILFFSSLFCPSFRPSFSPRHRLTQNLSTATHALAQLRRRLAFNDRACQNAVREASDARIQVVSLRESENAAYVSGKRWKEVEREVERGGKKKILFVIF
jgi:hypothetical protein